MSASTGPGAPTVPDAPVLPDVPVRPADPSEPAHRQGRSTVPVEDLDDALDGEATCEASFGGTSFRRVIDPKLPRCGRPARWRVRFGCPGGDDDRMLLCRRCFRRLRRYLVLYRGLTCATHLKKISVTWTQV